MPRRVSLPGAAELFRTTPPAPQTPDRTHHPAAATSPTSAKTPTDQTQPSVDEPTEAVGQHPAQTDAAPEEAADAQVDRRPGPARTKESAGAPRGSGRVRHDEKITVYVSSDELLELERARLSLRADHGMAVDRGRIVREALALVIGDLAERGADSDLVRRLSQP